MLQRGNSSLSLHTHRVRRLDFLREIWQILIRPRSREVSMVRELQLLTVGFVFLFLGAIVVGVVH